MLLKDISIAIVEDNADDLKNCVSCLERYAKESNKNLNFIFETYASGDAFLMHFNSQFDFIILDINLSMMNGIDVARNIRKVDENVIIMFATNLAKYATYGYEVDAIDFVLKPLNYNSLYLKLNRVMKRLEKGVDDNFVALQTTDGLQKVNLNEVYYVEVIAHSIIYHTMNGNYTTSGTLKKIEEQLKPFYFLRCNNCYLVNARKIKNIDKFDIKLNNDEIILISHPKKKAFMEAFKKYIEKGC